jgi:hypothetical protein
MRNLAAVAVLAATVSGCGLFRSPPPPTPLEASWNHYQTCIHQPRAVAANCERLRLAYEAQLNHAPR